MTARRRPRPALPALPPVVRLLLLAGLLPSPRAKAATDGPLAQPTASLRLGAAYAQGLAPPFFSQARDRLAVQAALAWQPAPIIGLYAQVDALRLDHWPDGADDPTRLGGGDIRLGTRLRLWTGPVEGGLRWELKLPNAEDEPELGTDETDVAALVDLGGEHGDLGLRAAAGVDVRGDPHRYRSQVVVPLVQARAYGLLGPVRARLRVDAELPAGGQPGRLELGIGAEGRCPWLSGGELLRGVTTTGPLWGARLWVGYGGGCPAQAAPSPRG